MQTFWPRSTCTRLHLYKQVAAGGDGVALTYTQLLHLKFNWFYVEQIFLTWHAVPSTSRKLIWYIRKPLIEILGGAPSSSYWECVSIYWRLTHALCARPGKMVVCTLGVRGPADAFWLHFTTFGVRKNPLPPPPPPPRWGFGLARTLYKYYFNVNGQFPLLQKCSNKTELV